MAAAYISHPASGSEVLPACLFCLAVVGGSQTAATHSSALYRGLPHHIKSRILSPIALTHTLELQHRDIVDETRAAARLCQNFAKLLLLLLLLLLDVFSPASWGRVFFFLPV